MTVTVRIATALVALVSLGGRAAVAQTFDGVGTRAQGMGAFVAVADDASAVYWNPGGLASGAYFSLVLDRTDAEAAPEGSLSGGSRSAWLLALSAPAVGLSYYRLRSSTVIPRADAPAGPSRVESLVTHHAGATLVHSLSDYISVGATVKLVRGIAHAQDAIGPADELLDDAELLGVASNRFDADFGVMATGRLVRAGLTIRNLTSPAFKTASQEELHLDRQARAGVSLVLTERWVAAMDLDLTRNRGPFGDVRTLAVGAEGRLSARAVARGGLLLNTADADGVSPAATVGGSYAAFGSLLIDAHVSTGSHTSFGGWGVAGRVVF